MQGFSADTVTKNRQKIIVSLKIRLITHIILRSIKYYIVKFTPSYQIRFSLMMSKHTDTNQITRYSTNFGGLISCTAFSPKPHLVLCQILLSLKKYQECYWILLRPTKPKAWYHICVEEEVAVYPIENKRQNQ